MPDEAAEIRFKDNADKIRYDFCTWNHADDWVEFYYDDELVAWVRSEKYRIVGKPAEEAEGQEDRIVS